MALPQAIALVLLAALPAFFNLASERIFEEEKALLLRAAALLALPGLLATWRAHIERLRREPIAVALAALVVMLGVAAMVGVDPREAFWGAYLKRHGVMTWLALAVVFAAMCETASSPIGRERLLDAIVIGSIWPVLYALIQRVGGDPVQWMGASSSRAISTLGSPNYFGGYIAIVIPLTALRARTARSLGVVVVLQLAALAAAASRGSLVGLAAGAAAAVAVVLWRRRQRTAVVSMTAAVVAVAAVLAAFPAARPSPIARFFDTTGGTGRVRVLVWQGVAGLMRESGGRRWIGYGPESLHAAFPPHYPAAMGIVEGDDAMPDRAHNETLDMWVSAGPAGVALEWILFLAIIVFALRAADPIVAAALAAAAIAHVVEIQLGIATVVSRLFFLSVAAIVVNADRVGRPLDAVPAAVMARSGPKGRGRAPDSGPSSRSLRPGIVAAAAIGALSPWIATSVMRATTIPVGGNDRAVVDAVAGMSLVTAWLYASLFIPVTVLAWGLARGPHAARSPWLLTVGTAVAAAAAIPIAITPSRADVFSRLAVELEAQQQWAAAATTYRQAARLQPREAYYLAGLGRSVIQDAVRLEPAARRVRLRGAREAFERALALAPSDLDNTRHLASLARIEASAHDGATDAALAEADALYAGATRRAPGFTPLWLEWAWVDVDRREWTHALEKIDRALALNGDRVDAWVLRGHVEAAQSRFAEAVKAYDAALMRSPDNADAVRGRAAAIAALQSSTRPS